MKEKIDSYSINLMWINSSKDENGEYICQGKDRKGMDYELTQLKKWSVSNPQADVNLWYDSKCTNTKAIENTKALLKGISIKVHLRDIREILFVQDNSDLFLPSIPVYFRIDFLKLIICLYLMECGGMDSVIFTDMSIGDKVERVLSKQELFNPEALKNLNQYSMFIGQDSWKPENQFLQTLNTPQLIESMKHAINCCLFLATNALNTAISKQYSPMLSSLHNIPFTATMVYVYLYLLVLQSKEPVKIRADIVKEGDRNEWVTYDPLNHGYIMFGNVWKPYELRSGFSQANEFIGLNKTIQLPESLQLHANITEFWGFNEEFQTKVLRTDLNPSKDGSGHSWEGALPLPTKGNEFSCAFWPQSYKEELHKQKTEYQVPPQSKPIILNPYHQDFYTTINLLRDKMDAFQQDLNFRTNPKLQEAYAAANTLYLALEREGNSFFSKKSNKNDYEHFRSHCKAHINNAREVLKQHRGWGKILLNIFAMIVTAGIGYAIAAGVNIAMNKGRFTFFSTDSAQKLSAIDEYLDNLAATAA